MLGKPGLSRLVEIVERMGNADETMVFAGSLALGLGNRTSDIDMLLLNPRPASRPSGPFQVYPDGCRVEVVRVDVAELTSQVGALSRALAAPGRLRLPHDRLRLLSRVAFGCPVAGPEIDAEFDRRLAETCHRTVIRRSEESARHHALVASLAVEQADHPIAAWNARGAVEAAIQAELSRRGVPYAGSKWTREQALVAGLPESLDALLDLPSPAGELPAYTRRCLGEVRSSLGMDVSLAALGRGARWDLHRLTPHRMGGTPVLLHLEDNVAVELPAAHESAWALLVASSDRTPIGAEPRAARDLAWELHLRGLAGIRWPGEEAE